MRTSEREVFESTTREQSEVGQCPVCGETRHSYLFVVRGLPVVRCPGCGLVSIDPQPAPTEYGSFYGDVWGEKDPWLSWSDSVTEHAAACRYLDILKARGVEADRILLVAPPDHVLVKEAVARGFEVTVHPLLDDWVSPSAKFDAAIILFQLEKASSPGAVLAYIRGAVKPEGVLLVVTPSIDSRSAGFFGRQWTEWRPENRYYFSEASIQGLLWRCGFEQVEIEKDRRPYTLQHIYDRAKAFPKTLLTRSIGFAYHALPPPLRGIRLRLPSSGIVVSARKGLARSKPLCSIVIPVYNEGKTFSILMDALLAKQLPGMDKEIIVVESNSTDGSRELVMSYQDHPEVRVVLQERPKGKGNAVREGLKQARGDIVMIQDADLEYDLNDYELLLDPLLRFQASFVLGSRHGGRWKMREFDGEHQLAGFMNLGHVFFTTLINLLYGQRLSDPFTMYKVFRRDCLHGLEFECNRFDFDHELVIKLVLKGYTPLEIPVNYSSRTFKEGKKVRLFRDPLTWIWTDFKYRFLPLRRRSEQR